MVDLKDGSYSETLATNDSLLLFTAGSTHICNLTFPESTNWKQCNWKHIIKQLHLQMKDLKKERKLKDVRAKIVRRIIFAYSGTPFPFSIDLISAVRRQREFTEKMVNNKWIDCIEIQKNATIRYNKFLSLMKEQNTLLVPTLDIDLAWHTHQIHASSYRAFTQKYIGRIINHDDTLTKGVLSNGFAVTARAWYKMYHEPYTHVCPSKYWLSTTKKVMSVIVPPYGLFVLYRLKKYQKATKKNGKHKKDKGKDTDK